VTGLLIQFKIVRSLLLLLLYLILFEVVLEEFITLGSFAVFFIYIALSHDFVIWQIGESLQDSLIRIFIHQEQESLVALVRFVCLLQNEHI
jgi:hypothetical protein